MEDLHVARSRERGTPTLSPSRAGSSIGRNQIRQLARIALLVGVYYATAKLGFVLEFAGPVAAIVWLPVGVGIAFLYLGGIDLWPGVVIGDLLVNDYMRLPLGSALGQTMGNLLEVLVATLLLRRLARGRSLTYSMSGVWCMIAALAAGTAISATVGPLALWLGGVFSASALPRVARTWWLGDFSGALLVVPLAVAWFRRRTVDRSPGHILEATLAFAALAATSLLAWRTNQPLTYVVFPALIWIAFRVGPRGATLAVVVAAAFAVSATTHFMGPFRTQPLSRSVLQTQLFILIASISTQCLAAVVWERERFARRLWASRARLVAAADSERSRLQRNLHDGAQQRLAGLMARLNLAAAGADEDSRHLLESAKSDLAAAIEEVRQLARGRNPLVLTDRGLGAAIHDMAEHSAIPVEVLAVPSSRMSEVVETTAYYVIAEAVANAQKHAQASLIQVLALGSAHGLKVETIDDGIGGAMQTPGSGIEGLRDRVEARGGTLEVDSPLGHGTRVTAWIPERRFRA
ncbi:MAG TPA: MASE1 domain-containing protein [Solirubrobacteraceae bacterium]|nr:MASE1 domain-containing protein [Solirubrobacteraceae bacterium]